jgi:class 3 adenylate cyclase
MLLTVSGCSILVTAYLGYRSGQSNLTERVFNHLTSVRASKANQIEFYFQTIRNHIETLSQTPSVLVAMKEFTQAYHELDGVQTPQDGQAKIRAYYSEEFLPKLAKTEQGTPVLETFLPQTNASKYLQYYYLAVNANPIGKKDALDRAQDDSNYSQIHSRYHPIFRNIINKFGYYDLFLIDPDGNIVYTVYKETDFASNLTTGAYNESNLAQLVRQVRQAKDKNYARVIDFQAYVPSYGAPASFMAIPLFDGSEFIGVLAVQMPVDEINDVMTGNQQWQKDGLGKTGETYLVGSDALMRSVSRFLIETPEIYLETLESIGVKDDTIERIRQYNTSIIQQKVETIGVEKALAGEQGTQIIKDYRNIPVLSSYAPLNIEGLDWVILSEIDLAEAYEPIYSFGNQLLIVATLLMLLVTIGAMIMAYLFVKPINKLIKASRQIQEGNLEAMAQIDTEDEFGELAKSFNEMIQGLRDQTHLIEEKNKENEQLLLSIFPAAIAKRLKRGEKNIAESVSNVVVLFSALTGFSLLSEDLTAYEIVAILNDLVTAFDEAAERHGLEKIKTIGDSYMAVCGLSIPYLDRERRALDLAVEMLSILHRFNQEKGFQLDINVGINDGDIVAGIVGTNKFIYDVWGDTINEANAFKSACSPGDILVSDGVYRRLRELYEFEAREVIDNQEQKVLQAWRLKTTREPIR